MKNCEEMVDSLFQRRERYVAEKKRKKKIIISGVSSVGCVCLVALLGVGMGQLGRIDPPIDPIVDDAVCSGEPDITEEVVSNKIVIHKIEDVPSEELMGIARMLDDFVEMTQEEMKDYYGMDYIPDVPDDLEALEHRPGIFKRNGGTGEIYWDEDEFRYFNADKSRDVSIRVAKGHLPYVFYNPFEGIEEMSKINGVEIPIGMVDHGCYYTEFVYKDVGFMIFAEGLTEAEFVDIIASVTD